MENPKPKVQNGNSLSPATDDSKSMSQSSDSLKQNGGCLSENGFLRKNLLTVLTILAVLLGIGLGFGLRYARTWTKREVMYVSFPGEIFLRMLRCLILPLIVSSLVSALGSLDTKLSGKIGIRAVAYYFGTTILAIILGIILVMAIRPGVGEDTEEKSGLVGEKKTTRASLTVDTMLDLIRNMFPPNIIQACVSQKFCGMERNVFYEMKLLGSCGLKRVLLIHLLTNVSNAKLASGVTITLTITCIRRFWKPPVNSISEVINSTVDNSTVYNSTVNELLDLLNATSEERNVTVDKPIADYTTWTIGHKMVGDTNILGLVVFSVVLGITLGRMHNAGRPLLQVFISLSDAMMIITKLVIWFSPVGVLFLVVGKILDMDDVSEVVGKVGMYTITVLVGLFIHGLVTLPTLYFIFVRKLPFMYVANMAQALATAFGTSSSSATLPVTISCLEEKNNIDSRVSRFCLPIGATINMDGTALYEAVAAIFIAQFRKVELSIGAIIGISITATAASIGAAGIPQAGLVTMVMVLNVVGLPADDVALIFVVDWFLDRFRTAINVLGDAIGSGIVAHLSVKDLETLETDDAHQASVEMTTL